MIIKTNTYHYKYYAWLRMTVAGYIPSRTSICGYFWNIIGLTLILIVMQPFALIGYLTTPIREMVFRIMDYKPYEDHSMPEYAGHGCGTLILSGVIFAVIYSICFWLGIFSFTDKKFSNLCVSIGTTSVLLPLGFYLAVKLIQKTCVLVEFRDE